MRSFFSIIVLLGIHLSVHAQVEFEEGYFIDLQGERTDCLIKNADWRYNPGEITYKLSEGSDPLQLHCSMAKEFGISDKLKYVGLTVEIDRSSDQKKNLTNFRNPDFHEERLFLKVLVEGVANLYSYRSTDRIKYFYSVGDSEIKQLVYKRYIADNDFIGINNYSMQMKYDKGSAYATEKVAENLTYQQQLIDDLKCYTIDRSEILATDYSRSELLKLFVKYSKCKDAEFTNYNERRTRTTYNFNLKPGYSYSTFSIRNFTSSHRNTDFGGHFSFDLGVEGEIILPYHRNKWAVFCSPALQSFHSELEEAIATKIVDYKSIEVPVGLRHYFFLNEKSKIYLSASFIYDIPIDSRIHIEYGQTLDITNSANWSTGAGYKYNDKFALELTAGFHRNLIGTYAFWYSDFYSLTLNFAYTVCNF